VAFDHSVLLVIQVRHTLLDRAALPAVFAVSGPAIFIRSIHRCAFRLPKVLVLLEETCATT